MSKIITKKQLDLVMESTIKEADYMMENKDELKLTKQHMDDDMKKESACNECGGNMVEGVCEGCSEMSEDKEAKPDLLDLNNDGDTEEDMKDAAKEKVEECKIENHFFGYYHFWDPQENYYYAVEKGGFKSNSTSTDVLICIFGHSFIKWVLR